MPARRRTSGASSTATRYDARQQADPAAGSPSSPSPAGPAHHTPGMHGPPHQPLPDAQPAHAHPHRPSPPPSPPSPAAGPHRRPRPRLFTYDLHVSPTRQLPKRREPLSLSPAGEHPTHHPADAPTPLNFEEPVFGGWTSASRKAML